MNPLELLSAVQPEVWLDVWIGFAPAIRGLLLLPLLAVVVGAVVLCLCRRHPETARIAWPLVLAAHLLAALVLLLLQPEGVRVVPVPRGSGESVRAGIDLMPLFVLWAVGAGLCALRTIAGVLRFRAGRASWRAASPRLVARLETLAGRLGTDAPTLHVADGAYPACTGVRRARILLPTAALGWSDARLEAVLAHELVHARRGDARLLLLCALLADLLFWLPGVRAVTEAWRRALEQSCDDEALRLTGAADEYALALVDQVRDAHAPRWLAALTGAAIAARVRRVLAGVGAGDFETGRVYWPVVTAAFLATPLLLAAPLPVAARAPVHAAPGTIVWLELGAGADEMRLLRPPIEASVAGAGLPAPGAPQVRLPGPALPPCAIPGVDARGPAASSHPPIQL